jgi:hypothetical protein
MRNHDWGTRALTQGLAAVLLLSLPLTGAAADRVAAWNVTAVRATLMAGENPTVQSRALAATQAAVHDALNAIDRRFEPYAFDGEPDPDASPDAAVATAARDALVGLIAVGPFAGFGSAAQQKDAVALVDGRYAADLERIPEGEAKTRGIAVGQAAAAAILAEREDDGATTFVSYTPGMEPGDWQPTPNPVPPNPPGAAERLSAVLPGWGQVTPFVLSSSGQFLPDGPPALPSTNYAQDYHEVQALGAKDSTVRTADQEEIESDRADRRGGRGTRCLGAGACARPGQPRDGGWRDRGLRDQVSLQPVASHHRHSRGGDRWQRGDGGRSDLGEPPEHARPPGLRLDARRPGGGSGRGVAPVLRHR